MHFFEPLMSVCSKSVVSYCSLSLLILLFWTKVASNTLCKQTGSGGDEIATYDELTRWNVNPAFTQSRDVTLHCSAVASKLASVGEKIQLDFFATW